MSQQAIRAGILSPRPAATTAFGVLVAISYCHFSNDLLQSLLPAIYPNLKLALGLSFAQIGFVTLAYQIVASLLQPVVGLFSDKRPTPLALPLGTLFSIGGLCVLAVAHNYGAAGSRRVSARRLIGDLPSRSIARRAHGLGRTARPRAIAVSSRRQLGLGARSAGGRAHRRALRSNEPRVLCAVRAARDSRAVVRRAVVPHRRPHALEGGRETPPARRRDPAPPSRHRASRFCSC